MTYKPAPQSSLPPIGTPVRIKADLNRYYGSEGVIVGHELRGSVNQCWCVIVRRDGEIGRGNRNVVIPPGCLEYVGVKAQSSDAA
jgi:hypothetical protein